ncbi:MAG TPA: hypothetical protein VE862_08400 [Candidatus Acidoferrum sp.]|nr:hypothetical protein [Candidatus Acidoferrum sp.]
MKRILGCIFLAMLIAQGATIDLSSGTASSEFHQTRLTSLVSYLVGHFNPQAGLIYESEDQGVHWLKRVEFPFYHWHYNQTFWIYSDNLFAMYALEPWRPDIANLINETFRRYDLPFSNRFEAVIGAPIGNDRTARDLIISQTKNWAILIRIHNGTYTNPLNHFADEMIYQALTNYYSGSIYLARMLVLSVYRMWNGTCLVDYGVTQTVLGPQNAPSDIQFCMNMKLALLLYACEVIGVKLPNFTELVEHLWNMQKENGGITTLSTGHGIPTGSANAETSALTLLLYNMKLIERLSDMGNRFLFFYDSLIGTLIQTWASSSRRFSISVNFL